MGNIYDWSRVIITCLPEYYKWNQWIFLQMYKRAWLIARKWLLIGVLLVKQCWPMSRPKAASAIAAAVQWNKRSYAVAFENYRLRGQALEDLETLDWPERTKSMQKNWIGRSEGAELEFPIEDSELKITVLPLAPIRFLA